jgi:hypothetical protein
LGAVVAAQVLLELRLIAAAIIDAVQMLMLLLLTLSY